MSNELIVNKWRVRLNLGFDVNDVRERDLFEAETQDEALIQAQLSGYKIDFTVYYHKIIYVSEA